MNTMNTVIQAEPSAIETALKNFHQYAKLDVDLKAKSKTARDENTENTAKIAWNALQVFCRDNPKAELEIIASVSKTGVYKCKSAVSAARKVAQVFLEKGSLSYKLKGKAVTFTLAQVLDINNLETELFSVRTVDSKLRQLPEPEAAPEKNNDYYLEIAAKENGMEIKEFKKAFAHRLDFYVTQGQIIESEQEKAAIRSRLPEELKSLENHIDILANADSKEVIRILYAKLEKLEQSEQSEETTPFNPAFAELSQKTA